MNGWLVNPRRLRTLRVEAQLTPKELAARVGCHQNHYHKLERSQQPSATLVWNIINELTRALGRDITLADIATPSDDRKDAEVAA